MKGLIKGLILIIAVAIAFFAYLVYEDVLAGVLFFLTIFGIGLSFYAYFIEKSSMGNLAGSIFAIVGLVGT